MRFIKSLLKFWLFVSAIGAAVALLAKKRLPVADDPETDELKLVAIFDACEVRSTASAFKGGSAIAGFGAIELDLRRAQAAPGGAHLDLIAFFAGIEVVVPDTWHVSGRGVGVAGGFDLERDNEDPADGQPTLRIDVKAVFGGVAVAKRPVVEAVAK